MSFVALPAPCSSCGNVNGTLSPTVAASNNQSKGAVMTKQITTMRKQLVNQTFSLTSPGAATVRLVGDFTHWRNSPITLHKQTAGIWRATVPLEPGEHH